MRASLSDSRQVLSAFLGPNRCCLGAGPACALPAAGRLTPTPGSLAFCHEEASVAELVKKKKKCC